MALLALLAATAVAITRMRSLFSAVMLAGIYSLLSACWMLVLDAPDVSFTEASVGAGISTVLFLGSLALTTDEEKKPDVERIWPMLVSLVVAAVLIYGTLDMPLYGDPNAPIHLHVAPEYMHEHEIGLPNVITSVLASYRGYDTLGETSVIFTAGMGVALLLGGRRRRSRPVDEGGEL